MTLWRFALTVAGPRDAVINVLINGPVCWYFLHSQASVPLTGRFSVEIFLGPMAFLLFSLATFFGVMNGVLFLRSGAAGPDVRPREPWRGPAIRLALTNGLAALAILLVAVHAIAWRWPRATISGWQLIGLQTALSAALGYCVQVNGVLRSVARPARASAE